MPPMHPAFVHFPIALVVFSFITDLLGRVFGRASFRWAAFWSLIGALILGAVTAATGYYDFTRDTLAQRLLVTPTFTWISVGFYWVRLSCWRSGVG